MVERCKAHQWVFRENLKGDVHLACAVCNKKRSGPRLKYPYRQRTLPPEHAVNQDGVAAWEAR